MLHPRLLVSVRDAQEVASAIAGGCDVLDVKEPIHGSLGFAGCQTIDEIVRTMHHSADASRIPISVALGELIEWIESDNFLAVPESVRYAKIGLSGTFDRRDWVGDWIRMRDAVSGASHSIEWIAVAYADHAAARAPCPDDVVRAAIDTGCAGILVDTFVKDGRALFDHLDTERLCRLHRAAADCGLIMALAGGIDRRHLPAVMPISPDIVAVRGAVCRKGDRVGTVDERLVREFRNAIHAECYTMSGPASSTPTSRS